MNISRMIQRTLGVSCPPQVVQTVSILDLQRVEEPFAIVSALPAEKSLVVSPLLPHYSGITNGQSGANGSNGGGGGGNRSGANTPSSLSSSRSRPRQRLGRVFVDLSNGIRGKGDSVALAADLGWTAYGIADVNAWTMVETFRLLVGENVSFDFVRLASGRSLFT